MNKLNRMERKIAEIIILAVVVILIGVLLRSFIYAPNNEQIAKQEAEIESLAEKVEESQKAPALIVSYREKINALIGGSEENANLLNKTNISREDFEKELKNILKYYFWSKAEWEVLIRAWCGSNGDEEIKIDVWDQIKWNWDRFVEYLWEMR